MLLGVETGPRPHAHQHERPDAGSKHARDQHHGQPRPAQTRRLDHDDRGDQRRLEDHREGGERTGGCHHGRQLLGRILSDPTYDEDPQAAAERYERCLRPEHDPESYARNRRQEDARQLNRLGHAGLEPLGRYVTSLTREPHDRDRDQRPGDREHGNRPPERSAVVVPDPVRELVPHTHLDLMDQLEEAPRGDGRHQADDGREHEQADKRPAPHDGRHIWGSGRLRRLSVLRHQLTDLNDIFEFVDARPQRR